MKKKSKLLFILIPIMILVVAIGGGCIWYFQIKKPYDQAVEVFSSAVTDFNAASSEVDEKNQELEAVIFPVQGVLDSGETPYDEQTLTGAKDAILKAQESKRAIPSIQKEVGNRTTKDIKTETENIKAKTEELKNPLDYSAQIAYLQESQKALENSIQQLKQITNPTEEFVTQRLQAIDGILGMQAVTEDNDPNGNLHKAGGYTSSIYFTSPLINQDDVYGESIIDKGTDAGGCIEVYEGNDDANKRNDYLTSFDGTGILNPGSHSIIGTIVVRTSSKLTATQQKELEQQIFDKFLELQ